MRYYNACYNKQTCHKNKNFSRTRLQNPKNLLTFFQDCALTAIEFIMAAILTGMIVLQEPSNWVVWIFAIGEICDAFDGICARRWPYPNDGKYRWWRVPRTVQFLEHTSDIWLVGACCVYIAMFAPPPVNSIITYLGFAIVCICVVVEVNLRTDPVALKYPAFREDIIIKRRIIYLTGVGIGMATLICMTTWPAEIKAILLIVGALIGVWLYKKKPDRL